MTRYVFDETHARQGRRAIATDIDLRAFAFEEKDGAPRRHLEFLLVVAHRETGEFFRYDQRIDMKLLPATTRERLSQQLVPGAPRLRARARATTRPRSWCATSTPAGWAR